MLENTLLNYQEHYIVCPTCQGYGTIPGTRKELYDVLRGVYWRVRDKIEAIKFWMDTDEIPCPRCDGEGHWIERW